MKKTNSVFLLIWVTALVSSCTSVAGRNQNISQNRSSNSGQESLFSSLFLDEENNPNSSSALRSEANRLPSSFPQPQKVQRQDIMAAMSPLHLTHIDGNTWRTSANPNVVYGIMTRIISQNYIIAAVDRKNFNVQTDWDKFFIDGRLFRNRLSVTVFPISARQTEVVIKNSVEYNTGSIAKQEENSAWLPSPDLTDEVNKLVESTDRQTAFAYSQSFLRN